MTGLLTFAVAISIVYLFARYVYTKLLLPQPVPGIPYHAASALRIAGDKPSSRAAFVRDGEVSPFRNESCRILGYPLIQTFMGPLLKPVMWLDDPYEVEDIALRRNKEFDRSEIVTAMFSPILGHSSIVQKSTPHFKAQRKLWQDVMAPEFLRRVVTPGLYEAALDLVTLWQEKAAKAEGKDFDIFHDFDTAALDAIWVAILGTKLGGLQEAIDEVRAPLDAGTTGKPKDTDGAMIRGTLQNMNKMVLGWRYYTLPPLQIWLEQRGSTFQKYKKFKDQRITELIRNSVKKFQTAIEQGIEHPESCAMDYVLRREVQAAHKASLPLADPTTSPTFRDELLLLLWAGFDTTSGTLSWWIKHMHALPTVQSSLRSALLSAFFPSSSTTASKLPTATQILEADIPYLDAVIEETLRLGAVGPFIRQATVDTTVLGKRIPKGANVVMNAVVDHRPVGVSGEVRSATSRGAKVAGSGRGLDGPAGEDLREFRPERWFVRDEGTGEVAFDANALPRLTFGGGPRGCFGKRLAMQELRIFITVVTLSFKMLPLAKKDEFRVFEGAFRKPVECFANLEPIT